MILNSGEISQLTGNFINNISYGKYGETGAIANSGMMTITNSNFINNKYIDNTGNLSGSVIWSTANLTISADNGSSLFHNPGYNIYGAKRSCCQNNISIGSQQRYKAPVFLLFISHYVNSRLLKTAVQSKTYAFILRTSLRAAKI